MKHLKCHFLQIELNDWLLYILQESIKVSLITLSVEQLIYLFLTRFCLFPIPSRTLQRQRISSDAKVLQKQHREQERFEERERFAKQFHPPVSNRQNAQKNRTTRVRQGFLHQKARCERAVLNHFAIKSFCTLWNNNWIQLLWSSYLFRKVQNALIAKWLSTTLSQMSILTVGTERPRHRMRNIVCESSVHNHFAEQ
jgi:hypothetical protein